MPGATDMTVGLVQRSGPVTTAMPPPRPSDPDERHRCNEQSREPDRDDPTRSLVVDYAPAARPAGMPPPPTPLAATPPSAGPPGAQIEDETTTTTMSVPASRPTPTIHG